MDSSGSTLRTLTVLRRRWAPEILLALPTGGLRYTDLLIALGSDAEGRVHDHTVANALRWLVAGGYVWRRADGRSRIYGLTDFGAAVVEWMAAVPGQTR